MTVAFVYYILHLPESKSAAMHKATDTLSDFFKDKFYGEGLIEILVGLVIMPDPETTQQFYPLRKPKYTPYKVIKDRLVGGTITIDRMLDYNIHFTGVDFETLVFNDDFTTAAFLHKKFLDTMGDLQLIQKKKVDFDIDAFVADLRAYGEMAGFHAIHFPRAPGYEERV